MGSASTKPDEITKSDEITNPDEAKAGELDKKLEEFEELIAGSELCMAEYKEKLSRATEEKEIRRWKSMISAHEKVLAEIEVKKAKIALVIPAARALEEQSEAALCERLGLAKWRNFLRDLPGEIKKKGDSARLTATVLAILSGPVVDAIPSVPSLFMGAVVPFDKTLMSAFHFMTKIPLLHHVYIGVAVGLVIDIFRICRLKWKGKITWKSFMKRVALAFARTGGAVLGAYGGLAVGTLLGSFLPGIGQAVIGFICSVIGGLLGRWWAGKKVLHLEWFKELEVEDSKMKADEAAASLEKIKMDTKESLWDKAKRHLSLGRNPSKAEIEQAKADQLLLPLDTDAAKKNLMETVMYAQALTDYPTNGVSHSKVEDEADNFPPELESEPTRVESSE